MADWKTSGERSPFAKKDRHQKAKLREDKRFSTLIKDRSFYSFLMADLSDQPFYLNHEKPDHRMSELDDLEAKYSGFARIREWLLFDRVGNAQSEMNLITPALSDHEKQLLPYLAKDMDWHHQAIMGAAKAALWNCLLYTSPSPRDS